MTKIQLPIKYKRQNKNFEEDKFLLEKNKYKWEKNKAIIIIIGVVASLFTVILGYLNFSNEREKEYEARYRETLFNLLSQDIAENKIGLKEIVKFDTHYEESVPLLINQLIMNDSNKYIELKNFYSSSAIIISKPLYPYFKEYLGVNAQPDSVARSRMQWLLSEFIKNNSNMKKQIIMDQLLVSDLSFVSEKLYELYITSSYIDNVVFDNSIFNSCDFSNTIFRNCSFWQSEFSRDVNLKNVRFVNCKFQESVIHCKFDNTRFESSYLYGLKVYDLQKDIFRDCVDTSTIQKIDN